MLCLWEHTVIILSSLQAMQRRYEVTQKHLQDHSEMPKGFGQNKGRPVLRWEGARGLEKPDLDVHTQHRQAVGAAGKHLAR